MIKHNNNLSVSLSKRCKCGRYITIGEERCTFIIGNYTCPDCLYNNRNKLSSEEYYRQFSHFGNNKK